MNMVFQLGILAALTIMAVIAGVNVFTIRSLGSSPGPRRFPMVSVLVPARNEEGNIGQCIASLADQDYPDYEILVLDDNSDDGTAAIVQKWEQLSRRVRYLKGAALPPGWTGKNFACHQLSVAAKGDLLLFVDADTQHARESVTKGVAALEHFGADLLTVLPRQILKTFWEKTLLPMMHFSLFCFLPFPLVEASRDPRFAMANGQYMLFRRTVYDAVGGHRGVKDVMVEDVWLSRLVKKNGFGLRIVEGGSAVSCRMYSSLRGIWHGFSKNLFAGFKFSLRDIVLVVLFNFTTSILPFISLAGIMSGMMQAAVLPIVATQLGVLLAIRMALSARFKMSYSASFLHPLAMFMVIGMAANSVRWVLLAGGSRWKGRAYEYKKQLLATTKGQQ